MSDKPLNKDTLIEKFAQSLGIDQAQTLIQQALGETGLTSKSSYYKEDVLALAKVLKSRGGLIGIVANCLAAEAYHLPSAGK